MFVVQLRAVQCDYQCKNPEKKDWKLHLLCMLEAGGEHDLVSHRRVIMDWTWEIRNRPQVRRCWVGGR